MSLSFSYKDVENSEEVCLDYVLDTDGVTMRDDAGNIEMKLNPKTDTLVWSTLWLGIREITKANYRKFYARLRMYNDLFGAALQTSEAPNVIAVSEITGDDKRYLVGSMSVSSAVQFCRKHYVEAFGGQDDPEYWSKMLDDIAQLFDAVPHGTFAIDPEGYDGEVSFGLEGSELLGNRIFTDAITLDVVKSHIGLSTNASTKTDAQFRKMIYDNLMERTQKKISAEEAEL